MPLTTKQHRALDQVTDLLETALGIVANLQMEKETAFNEKSERWQEGEMGQEAMGELSFLQQTQSAIGQAQECVAELTGPV
jgi:hypothetical protein